MKKPNYILAWYISLLVGSLFAGLVNGVFVGLFALLFSAVFSIPYIICLVVLDHFQRLKKFSTVYIIGTAGFLGASAWIYFTPSTLPYFSFTIVPYYLCGMIILAFQETKEIEKKKSDQLNAE